MAKFAKTATMQRPAAKTATTATRTRTHEGGSAFAMDAKTELFTAAAGGFYAEDQFYRTGITQANRINELVSQVTKVDPEWVQGFIPWLRDEANIRSAAIAAACEYAHAGGPNSRQVIAAACSRADEPAEVFGYWISHFGRKMPAGVKRGIADAAQKLYNERSALKYDQNGSNVRMGDVIAMTRPSPVGEWQSQLFTYLMDMRHNRTDPRGLDSLPVISGVRNWRSEALGGNVDLDLPSGVTWEALSSHTKMDAKAWEAMIPQMGYMALLRNLRNFSQAGISDEAEEYVISKLQDPDEVARSRQLPFRFWSAWKNSESVTYGRAISKAIDYSMDNVPRFGGKTLILVDTSGSMTASMSGKSQMQMVDAAALFGAAVARRSDDATLVAFGTESREVKIAPSVIKTVEAVRNTNVGYGTNTWQAVKRHWKSGYDRVLIFSDMQSTQVLGREDHIPKNVPLYYWNLAGYGKSDIQAGSNRYILGGLSDQSFKMIKLLEDFKPGNWPWES